MTLYEKQPNGRYKEHVPKPINMPEIDTEQVVTLLSALTISMLISVEDQLPRHAALARRVQGVEEAVKKLALLNGAALDPKLIDAGVAAWNGAIHAMQRGLSGTTN